MLFQRFLLRWSSYDLLGKSDYLSQIITMSKSVHTRKNTDLKKIYNKAFKKGEQKHFTKFMAKEGVLPVEDRMVLERVKWKGKRVLDVGCGTGLLVHEIAKRGGEAIGIDYSKDAIDEAKSLHQHPRVEYREEDIYKTYRKYKKESFDYVVSLGTVEHLDKPFESLKLFKTFLKPGGSIIITCPNWTNPRGFVLQTMLRLFDAPITLADIHYFSPRVFEEWAKRNNCTLQWETFDESWGAGEVMINDFKRRLPNVLRDMEIKNDAGIKSLITWLEKEALTFPWTGDHIGATALYHFKVNTKR